MTDRPIIFSGPMVRALLDGRKTQTRGVINPPRFDAQGCHPAGVGPRWWDYWCSSRPDVHRFKVPYATGDRIWVREAHSLHRAHGQDFKRPADDHGERWGPWSGLPIAVSPDKTQVAYYREGFDRSGAPKWRPSIHMPRWASRLTLTVTDVRVQRLQDISEADAVAEGINAHGGRFTGYGKVEDQWMGPIDSFASRWISLHGPDAWDTNPWVVALTFTVDRRNIDAAKEAEE